MSTYPPPVEFYCEKVHGKESTIETYAVLDVCGVARPPPPRPITTRSAVKCNTKDFDFLTCNSIIHRRTTECLDTQEQHLREAMLPNPLPQRDLMPVRLHVDQRRIPDDDTPDVNWESSLLLEVRGCIPACMRGGAGLRHSNLTCARRGYIIEFGLETWGCSRRIDGAPAHTTLGPARHVLVYKCMLSLDVPKCCLSVDPPPPGLVDHSRYGDVASAKHLTPCDPYLPDLSSRYTVIRSVGGSWCELGSRDEEGQVSSRRTNLRQIVC